MVAYNFTGAALRRILARGLSPAAVWQAVDYRPHVVKRADPYVLVLGLSETGEYLAVLVLPADEVDETQDVPGWDIVDARLMHPQEREAFDKITRRKP